MWCKANHHHAWVCYLVLKKIKPSIGSLKIFRPETHGWTTEYRGKHPQVHQRPRACQDSGHRSGAKPAESECWRNQPAAHVPRGLWQTSNWRYDRAIQFICFAAHRQQLERWPGCFNIQARWGRSLGKSALVRAVWQNLFVPLPTHRSQEIPHWKETIHVPGEEFNHWKIVE